MKLKISIVSSSCIPNSFQLHPWTLPPLLTFAGIVSWWPVFFRLLGYTSMEIMIILKVKWTSQCQITSGPCLNCSVALFLSQMDRLDPVGGLDFKLPKKHTETHRNTQKHAGFHLINLAICVYCMSLKVCITFTVPQCPGTHHRLLIHLRIIAGMPIVTPSKS